MLLFWLVFRREGEGQWKDGSCVSDRRSDCFLHPPTSSESRLTAGCTVTRSACCTRMKKHQTNLKGLQPTSQNSLKTAAGGGAVGGAAGGLAVAGGAAVDGVALVEQLQAEQLKVEQLHAEQLEVKQL